MRDRFDGIPGDSPRDHERTLRTHLEREPARLIAKSSKYPLAKNSGKAPKLVPGTRRTYRTFASIRPRATGGYGMATGGYGMATGGYGMANYGNLWPILSRLVAKY